MAESTSGHIVKRKGLVACFFAFLLWSLPCGPSHAFKQADVDKLIKTRACQWCDLGGVELSGAKLSHADVSGANLSKAKLSGADLSGADLSGAYLRDADLSGADLTDTYLRDANLTGANLSGTNLPGADLTDAVWTDGSKCHWNSIGSCRVPNLLGAYD
jgi:uncharacterized protein YjbI with pentapeptide repeats